VPQSSRSWRDEASPRLRSKSLGGLSLCDAHPDVAIHDEAASGMDEILKLVATALAKIGEPGGVQ
jgi:hypothetical protein